MVKVNVTAGDTTIPAPTLAAGAYIKNTNNGTASAAMFMALAQTNGVYPEGTKVEWADPAKVQKDAQTAGTYDEEVILDFPDGTKSKAFNVPGVLVVAAKQTPSTDPTTPTEANHTLPATSTLPLIRIRPSITTTCQPFRIRLRVLMLMRPSTNWQSS